MRSFARKNRKSLAALLTVFLLAAAAVWFMAFAPDPVTKDRRYEVNSVGQSNLNFWIITWEPYDGTLWIGPPAGISRETFDRLTGCLDATSRPPLAIPLRWTIKSVFDDSIAAEGKGAPTNPAADDCASTRAGHVLSLGKIAIAPGRYRFDLQFGEQLPDSTAFPVEVSLSCCFFKTPHKTTLGGLPGVIVWVIFPVLFLTFCLLILILIIRAGMYIFDID
jgi:hypothetical protein